MTKQFHCEICNFTTLYKFSLVRHNKSNKHFMNEYRLKKSTKVEEPKIVKVEEPKIVEKVEEPKIDVKKEKMFSCTLCNYSTKIKSIIIVILKLKSI